MLLLHGDVGDAVGVAVPQGIGDVFRRSPTAPRAWPASRSSDRSGRNRRTSDRSGSPSCWCGMAITEMFSSSSSKRSPAASRTNAMRSASGSESALFGAPPVSPMMFGPLCGEGEQLVAVARDEDRNVGCVLVHVLGDMAQPRDALARRRVRQFGLLELLLDVPRAEAIESAAGQVAQRRTSRASSAGR